MNPNEYILRHSFPHPAFFSCSEKMSKARLSELCQVAQKKKLQPAKVYAKGVGQIDRVHRNSRIVRLASQGPVFEKMRDFALATNEKFWNFAGPFKYSKLQYAEYGPGEHFDWHYDNMYGFSSDKERIITVVLFLSNRKQYSGGQFEIKDITGKILVPLQEQGNMVCFSAAQYHRVSKIIAGQRQSLTLWLSRQ